jgi:hypothetical protein
LPDAHETKQLDTSSTARLGTTPHHAR